MDADACRKPASRSLPPPPALFRARSGRVADLTAGAGGAAFSGPPDTPPRPSLVTVPFIWEDAPGKPKPSPSPPTAAETPAVAAANAGGPVPDTGHADTACQHRDSAHADPRPLKLPPRLQQVPSFAAAAEYAPSTPSPKTVFQGPYHGGGSGRSKPPKWVRSGGAALRKTPSAGVALLSRTWSKRKAPAPASGTGKNRGGDHDRDAAAGPRSDAPWCSPASSSSASSVSISLGRDDHGRGRHADAREASSSEDEDDGSPRASVRFTRNRSLPNMTTSNLWASVRRSVKHITPILHGAKSWATTRYGHW